MMNAPARAADRPETPDQDSVSRVSQLKGMGYLSSVLSVLLLGIPALKSASEDDRLLACLVAGMIASIVGMFLRWRSHRLEQMQKGS
jgi:hypothetical protein